MSLTIDSFVGDGTQTQFTLSADPGSPNNVIVQIEANVQLVSAYTISGQTLTFSQAPASGSEIEVRLPAVSLATPISVDTYTGDGTTTTFAISGPPPQTKNNVLCMISGVVQTSESYYVAGSDLVFFTAPANGQAIEIRGSVLGITTPIGIRSYIGDGVTTDFDLLVTPASKNDFLIFLNGVVLLTSGYDISANILLLPSAPVQNSVLEVHYLQDQVPVIGVVADGSVTTPKLADDAVTIAKIASNAVGDEQLTETGVTAGSYSNPTVTVDANGRVLDIASGSVSIFNVKAYGATGDGTTDDYSAIMSAIAAIPASGGMLFFPAGRYRSSGRLTISNRPINVVGAGIAVTEIFWDNAASSGIQISQNDETYFTTVQSMTLASAQPVANQTALEIDFSQSGIDDRDAGIISVSDLMIMPTTEATDGWHTGIHLIDGHGAKVDSITLRGNNAGNSQAQRTVSQHGIHIGGSTRLPVEIIVERVRGFYWHTVVLISSSSSSSPNDRAEGIRIGNCDFVAVGRGVHANINENNASPHFSVYETHVNFYEYGVFFQGTVQTFTSNCLFYQNPNGVQNAAGVYSQRSTPSGGPAANSRDNIITGNTFVKLGQTYDYNAIVIEGDRATIANNIVNSSTTAIWIKKETVSPFASPTSMAITGNVIESSNHGLYLEEANNISIQGTIFNNVLTEIANISSTDVKINNGFKGCLLHNNSDFGAGIVSWSSETYDTDGFHTSGSQITIPAGKGIQLVRVSCQGSSRGNGNGSTGVMILNIKKNGAGNYPGEARYYQSNIPMNVIASAEVQTAVIPVADNDVFECEFGLSSGNFDYRRCWFSIEVIG
ncbi:hypothetical protein NUH88_18395 [Nisaea acidiphila]|uniref:Rhamnogalacturonase A/B/Epimerase-like pectate lyase domain-containing protein n=1 Tax=Nisaea acidiphila TaxID=1862145 RepID=A0A9J7AVB5_9PROT|nr:right-handed parallel beta-helix repeat-containing protein [Nisaea acidiphila]UUX49357.1 hypothetical protein NUH88_18395 [Nisaea acidiphila]